MSSANSNIFSTAIVKVSKRNTSIACRDFANTLRILLNEEEMFLHMAESYNWLQTYKECRRTYCSLRSSSSVGHHSQFCCPWDTLEVLILPAYTWTTVTFTVFCHPGMCRHTESQRREPFSRHKWQKFVSLNCWKFFAFKHPIFLLLKGPEDRLPGTLISAAITWVPSRRDQYTPPDTPKHKPILLSRASFWSMCHLRHPAKYLNTKIKSLKAWCLKSLERHHQFGPHSYHELSSTGVCINFLLSLR